MQNVHWKRAVILGRLGKFIEIPIIVLKYLSQTLKLLSKI